MPSFSAVMPALRPDRRAAAQAVDHAEREDRRRGDRRLGDRRRGFVEPQRGEQVLRRGRRRGRDRPAEADQERDPARQERRERAVRLGQEDVIAPRSRQGGRKLAQRQRPAEREHPADHPEGEHQLVAADEVDREPRRRQDARADHARDDHEGRRRQAESRAVRGLAGRGRLRCGHHRVAALREPIAPMPRVLGSETRGDRGVGMPRNLLCHGPQRFLSVIPIPAPSMSTNDVSRSGLVVIAST